MGLNLEAIAKLLAGSNSQMGGILGQAQQAAQAGNSPSVVMDMMEGWMPGAKDKLANNQMWQSLKGKSPQEIEGYANNLVGTLGIFKK